MQGLDGLFTGHPTAELYVVMICCPLLLNICQVGASLAVRQTPSNDMLCVLLRCAAVVAGKARKGAARLSPSPREPRVVVCWNGWKRLAPTPRCQHTPALWWVCGGQALIQDLVLKWRARGGAKETSMAATGAAEREASLLGAATERSAPV